MNLFIQCILVAVGFFCLVLVSICIRRFKVDRLPLLVISSTVLLSIILYLVYGELNNTVGNALIIGALLSIGIEVLSGIVDWQRKKSDMSS